MSVKSPSWLKSQIRNTIKQAYLYCDLAKVWLVVDDDILLLRELTRLEDFLELSKSKKANALGLEIRPLRRQMEDLFQ